MRVCPHCSGPVSETARFCSSCGASLMTVLNSLLLSPGTELGKRRYRIEAVLGTGGMGAVYLAWDAQANRWCAVKEMLDQFADPRERAEAERSFQREVDILRGLYHVSIPEFYDAFAENARHYLVMEYIEGQDLEKALTESDEDDQVVRQGAPMDWQQVVKCAIQICDVLTYLHSHEPNPIVYRDMKPANVMISTDGRRLVLTDFGIARFFAAHTKGTVIGTPGYAPPEQYAGIVEPRSDLYALAATMHHLLTGDDPRQPRRPRTSHDFPRIRSYDSGLPAWLDEIVDTNLRYDVSERYDSAEQLREALMSHKPRKTICPKCAHHNPPGRPYCEVEGCGYPLSRKTVSCSQCGTANVINTRFCINCGTAL